MEADKNSSPKREPGLCPKFTTKDSHTSLPRSRSHNGPTNPRNKPQTIPKRKHNSRSKGLSNPTQCQADGPRAWGGRSANTGRTVCYPQADSPLIATEPPEAHPEKRTVRTWSSDGPQATGAARTVREPHADSPARRQTVRYPYTDGLTNLLQQNFDTSKDLRASSQELDEHAKNLHLVDGPQPMGGQSASPQTKQPEVKTEKSTSAIPPWISQTA
jgi:hypothetical protein